MPAKKVSEYASYLAFGLVESAANTLTFKKLDTDIGIESRLAWVLNRLELFFTIDGTIWNASGDFFDVSLCTNGALSNIADLTQPAVLIWKRIYREDIGAAASGFFVELPITVDLSTLPGGGFLCRPNPLYMACKGTGLTAAQVISGRIWYQPLELSDADFVALTMAQHILIS